MLLINLCKIDIIFPWKKWELYQLDPGRLGLEASMLTIVPCCPHSLGMTEAVDKEFKHLLLQISKVDSVECWDDTGSCIVLMFVSVRAHLTSAKNLSGVKMLQNIWGINLRITFIPYFWFQHMENTESEKTPPTDFLWLFWRKKWDTFQVEMWPGVCKDEHITGQCIFFCTVKNNGLSFGSSLSL